MMQLANYKILLFLLQTIAVYVYQIHQTVLTKYMRNTSQIYSQNI